MFKTINDEFNHALKNKAANKFIVESVLAAEEVLPGSEEEMEDVTDVDSIPDDVYKKLDSELDKIVNDPKYDDTEAEELLDDDDYDEDNDTGIDDSELDAIVNEAADSWYDDENIHHPNTGRKDGTQHQPMFKAPGQESL